VYNHLDEGIQKPMNYRNVFPTEKMCNWNTIGHFHPSQPCSRDSSHTEAADRKTGYPHKTCAPAVLPPYLGREDQSVNEKVLMKRIDQQIRVTELVAKYVSGTPPLF